MLNRRPANELERPAPRGLSFAIATEAEAAAIAAVRKAAADELTRSYGRGHWSGGVTERGEPRCQRRGVGRILVEEAKRAAIAWPADAVRLDAYDSHAGAGPFYAKCGFSERGRVVYRNVPLTYHEWLPT